jgi:hypothetical protein
MAGANRNYELKEPQIFTEFSFIWFSNLKDFDLRKSDFIMYNIYFSTRGSYTLPQLRLCHHSLHNIFRPA